MSLLRAASLIALLSLASKFVGLFRDQVIAFYCGLSAVTDAYQAASLIPAQFALIMLGGLNGPFHSAIVSTLMKHYEQGERGVYGRVLSTALLSSLLVMGLGSVLLFVFAPQIIQLWGQLPDATLQLAILQLRIIAPVFLISGLIGILYGILAIKNSFVTPSLSPILASLGVMLALVFFSGPDQVSQANALAWGTLGGAIAQLGLQLIPLFGFFRGMHFEIKWRDPEFLSYLHLLLPAVLSSSIGQVNMFIIQFFAAGLREGSLAAFRFGNLITQLPLGILLTALLVPLLPLLTAAAQEQTPDHLALKTRLNQGLRPILMLTFPITVLLAAYGLFAVRMLFERGRFTSADSWLTYEVLVFLVLSITVYAIRDLLIRVYYALGDSRTPFMTSFITIAALFGFSLLLVKPLGVGGVALASSLAAGLNFVVLALLLRRRIGVWMQRDSWIHLSKVALASLPLAVLGYFSFQNLAVQPDKLWGFIQASAEGILLSIAYALILLALKDREVLLLAQRFKRRH
ncbi:MAG: murein biosynthesis integral membrane protein MurJ [Candidatus Melainabacteria bacterium HGW-Melainabacteria-1]|nr:MAG: murein biosynthesis integral membrane protein MurJ [Candidatus Melainabacteria bacterium HGW-Melainabacteria-1]